MKKLLPLLTHPVVLSLSVTVVIILLFFPHVSKYMLEIKEQIYKKADKIEFWDDLDGNKYSDRILFTEYPNNITAVTVLFKGKKDLNEWTVRGRSVFTNNNNFFTGDFDGNGTKEIYVFTVINDSLFLHQISRLFEKPPLSFTRFVAVIGHGVPDDQLHINLVTGGLEDFNRDGFKELVFGVNFGNSVLPRYVYSYDIKNDTLNISPKNGYFLSNLTLADVNGDSTKEVIINGYASQNYKDTVAFPVHDLYCRLIVLDKHLQYLFPPVRFTLKGYSTLGTFAIPDKSGRNSLYSLYCPPLESGKPFTLFHFDKEGKMICKKEISGIQNDLDAASFLFYQNQVPHLAIGNLQEDLFIFDTTFQLGKKMVFPLKCFPYATMDLDGDHEGEFLVLDSPKSKMAVLRSDLSDPAYLNLTLDLETLTNCSLRNEPGRPPVLIIDSGLKRYSIQYTMNQLFYTRWLIYAGLFLAIYLLILLIARLQRLQIESRLKTEKKITELQLKIVRNQMDPHFTMNAINAVIDAINREEKEQARDNLLHFSKMYRSLVLSADKFKRTLREEIDFTENYLALEQFRFSNRFSYKIEVDEDVDLSVEVPKMVIQSPVENAVKHGLDKKYERRTTNDEQGGGEILIRAGMEGRKLVLEISDNGIGREAAANGEKTGTGKGMEMMEQFFELYQKITGVRVQSMVSDLKDRGGKAIGTKVVVTLTV